MTAEREWLKVGAVAGLVCGYTGRDTVAKVTVEKIGKRDVVLSDGTRVNVRTLRKSSTAYGPTYHLEPLDDPRVVRAFARQRRDNCAYRVEELMRELRNGDDQAAARALGLLTNYVGGAA